MKQKFTFHNVSINSGHTILCQTFFLLFTFHNVSINSRPPTTIISSIVFLLFLVDLFLFSSSYIHIFIYNFALSLYLSHCRPSYIFTSLLVDNFYYLYIDKNLINRLHFTFHQDCSFIIASISAFYNINLTGIIFFFLY